MIQQRTPRMSRIALLGLAALFSPVLSSCVVSQEQYNKATSLAEMYQDQVHSLENENQLLIAESNRLMTESLDAYTRGLQEAGYDKDAQGRIDELQARIEDLGRPMGDIETFRVDGGYVTMIRDDLLFASGSADLNQKGIDALKKVALDIKASPHGQIQVRGHTDSDPIKKASTLKAFPKGNIQLSAERAVSVAVLMLKQKGLSGKDLLVLGFGSHRPLRPNNSAENKRLNRRVEIFVADAGE